MSLWFKPLLALQYSGLRLAEQCVPRFTEPLLRCSITLMISRTWCKLPCPNLRLTIYIYATTPR